MTLRKNTGNYTSSAHRETDYQDAEPAAAENKTLSYELGEPDALGQTMTVMTFGEKLAERNEQVARYFFGEKDDRTEIEAVSADDCDMGMARFDAVQDTKQGATYDEALWLAGYNNALIADSLYRDFVDAPLDGSEGAAADYFINAATYFEEAMTQSTMDNDRTSYQAALMCLRNLEIEAGEFRRNGTMPEGMKALVSA